MEYCEFGSLYGVIKLAKRSPKMAKTLTLSLRLKMVSPNGNRTCNVVPGRKRTLDLDATLCLCIVQVHAINWYIDFVVCGHMYSQAF
jgi:hypothetical protein